MLNIYMQNHTKGASKKTGKKLERASSAGKTKSPTSFKPSQTRKQRRHGDRTFAKGFKQHTAPNKRSTRSTTKETVGSSSTRITKKVSNTNHRSRKSSTSRTQQAPSGPKLHSTGRKNDSIGGYTPQMRIAETKFNFKCSEAMKKKVLRVATDNFSKKEIDMMDRYGKPTVVNENISGTNGGYSRQTTKDKTSAPTIILKTNPSEVTITHELVHHMRTIDNRRDKYAKTAYPIISNGTVRCERLKTHNIRERVRNAEETATTAETELRVKNKSEDVSGYWKIDTYDVSGKKTRDSDRNTLRSNGAIKEGTNVTDVTAIKQVNKEYPKTIISSRRASMETALSTFKWIISWREKKRW